MKRLNRQAARLMQAVGVSACTDITGFGLVGHALEMAEQSEVGIRFHLDRLPFLPGACHYAGEWLFPAGTCRNEAYYAPRVRFASEIPEKIRLLLYTPETSGGLLIAVPAKKAKELTACFEEQEQSCWAIGEVVEEEGIKVVG